MKLAWLTILTIMMSNLFPNFRYLGEILGLARRFTLRAELNSCKQFVNPSTHIKINTGVKLNKYLERVSQIRKNTYTPSTVMCSSIVWSLRRLFTLVYNETHIIKSIDRCIPPCISCLVFLWAWKYSPFTGLFGMFLLYHIVQQMGSSSNSQSIHFKRIFGKIGNHTRNDIPMLAVGFYSVCIGDHIKSAVFIGLNILTRKIKSLAVNFQIHTFYTGKRIGTICSETYNVVFVIPQISVNRDGFGWYRSYNALVWSFGVLAKCFSAL